MDLIDLLHVNNDIMSYSLAFASLAYSVGGLLSGFLFNYVNRQILISAYFLIFGISNIITPFISNYTIFSVITVFKMMCAGGTDCGANVWILEMWPGKDAWLQALHFAFACGCALGPLIVEPFLSVEYKDNELDKITGKMSGSTTISDQNNETRIHIPYGFSGLTSISAALFILYLYFLAEFRRKRNLKLSEGQKQQLLQQQQLHTSSQPSGKGGAKAAGAECILLASIQHPASIEAAGTLEVVEEEEQEQQQEPATVVVELPAAGGAPEVASQADGEASSLLARASQGRGETLDRKQQQQPQAALAIDMEPRPAPAASNQAEPEAEPERAPLKITSKVRSEEGKPPYYVMFAIALAALCLSFYCGIEITSMNYLATFAVNIDLQLPKSTAALMSSALTISFAVGRAFGIWIAAYLKPHKLFYLCAFIMASGNVLMLIFANTAEMLLWYSICLFGIGCGPMFPAIVSFYDDRISKVTNTVSGIFILGSMFNVALNSLIIGHHIIDNALILIVCNLVGSVVLLLLFGTLHMLTCVKKNQRVRKFKLKQQTDNNNRLLAAGASGSTGAGAVSSEDNQQPEAQQEQPGVEAEAAAAAEAPASEQASVK